MKELKTVLGDHHPIYTTQLAPEITVIDEEKQKLLKNFDLEKNYYFGWDINTIKVNLKKKNYTS